MSDSEASVTGLARATPWHVARWRQFSALVADERLPHALLLEAPSGTGRGLFADAMARSLLCRSPLPEGICGTCKTCSLMATGAHGDLRTLAPTEPGKAIGIDSVRQAITFVAGTAGLGQRKVLIVNPAEAMTTAAFNAFLKCLEEPTANTYIILVAARGQPLPATIRSRCQRWVMPAPSAEEARDWLRRQAESGDPAVDGNSLAQILELTDNRPLQALEIAQSGEAQTLLALTAAITSAEPSAQVEAERQAAKLDNVKLIDTLERLVQRWLRARDGDGLRKEAARRAFEALDELARLRAAQRAGSNPNPDLLRFTALNACSGLWAA